MPITPQDALAIGGTVTILAQVAKRMMPGDFDAYGIHFAGAISLLAVIAWVLQQPPVVGRVPWFDWLTLWATIWSTSAGGYELARMTTATTARSVAKLRAMRDAAHTEAA